MFLKLYVSLIAMLFTPHTQVLSIKQADKVLDVSVLLRVKQYSLDDDTLAIKRGMAGCSGTFVSPTEVLTAAHCFSRPTTDVWVRGTDHVSHRANIAFLDPEHDLALLKVVKLKTHAYAKIADKARVGERVINVGSPFSLEFLVSEGIVASLRVKSDNFKSLYTITTAMINPGSSGGGAFNSDGELIGVNTMSMGGPFGWAGISMAVDIETIKGFLRVARNP